MLHVLLPVVYIVHRDLHPILWPAHVTRFDDMTILQLNRSSLRAEVVFWSVDNLTPAERRVIRIAYETDPDLRVPVRDDILEGQVHTHPIPDCLRLPSPLVPAQSA